ncbi:hypothetical protein [Salibacterium aidingense]|uniref:hypothetical protein n=1 Tax=Salibacterium aidingense TaxID=384933 RepID=UPI003BD0398F
MSSCNIDHSLEEVQTKLESQKEFLPAALYRDTELALHREQPQEILNEVFHLLKKYDLADPEEQENRNTQLQQLFENEQ